MNALRVLFVDDEAGLRCEREAAHPTRLLPLAVSARDASLRAATLMRELMSVASLESLERVEPANEEDLLPRLVDSPMP